MNRDLSLHEFDALIDRLVDGELSDAEYRSLLGSLDETADGWKRVAIGFLENQALAKEIGLLRREADPVATTSLPPAADLRPVAATARRGGWRSAAVQALGIAASFLIVFGLGMVLQRAAFQRGEPGRNSVPDLPLAAAPATVPGMVEPASLPAPAQAPLAPPRQLQVLVHRGGEDGEVERLELPVVDWNREQAWALSQPPASVPADVQNSFRRVGRELQRRREWMQVETAGGHRVVVPVDQFEVVPVKLRYE